MATDLLKALAGYIQTLTESSEQTHRAEDRRRYTEHLATAARIFVAVHQDSDTLRQLVADERRAYGWSYLADETGARAERAFNEFAAIVDGHGNPIS
jgi:hypothetical protein